jgi:hypothetical protein
MPTTAQNVAWLHLRNPKYSAAQILEFLNEVHMNCVHQEIDYFTYRDPTTGLPPYLVTTAGVYTYDCPDNCRKTSKVFLHGEKGWRGGYHYHLERSREHGDEFMFDNRFYTSLPNIIQRDAYADVLATVTFGGHYDPGTHSNRYHHLYYIKANQILTIDDQMQLPDELHFGIRKAISAYMATEDYGESSQDESTMMRIAKDVRNKLGRGASGFPTKTLWRPENRDYY